jgi:hypothetical protein
MSTDSACNSLAESDWSLNSLISANLSYPFRDGRQWIGLVPAAHGADCPEHFDLLPPGLAATVSGGRRAAAVALGISGQISQAKYILVFSEAGLDPERIQFGLALEQTLKWECAGEGVWEYR